MVYPSAKKTGQLAHWRFFISCSFQWWIFYKKSIVFKCFQGLNIKLNLHSVRYCAVNRWLKSCQHDSLPNFSNYVVYIKDWITCSFPWETQHRFFSMVVEEDGQVIFKFKNDLCVCVCVFECVCVCVCVCACVCVCVCVRTEKFSDMLKVKQWPVFTWLN